MDPVAAKYLGAGIAAIGMGTAAIGVGIIFGNYLSAAIRNPSAAQADPSQHAEIELGAEWRFFEIPFAGMKQRGFGRKVTKPDVKGILGVSIGFGTGSWDFWVDDVAFYRER